MKRSVTFPAAILALLALTFGASRLDYRSPAEPQLEPATPAAPATVAPPAPNAKLTLLLQRGAQEAAPIRPEPADNEHTPNSQISAAAEDLRDIDIDMRIGGAEQLAAYPSPRSEQLLVEALQTDTESRVRAAAATALETFRQPNQKTFAALTQSLEDDSEEVQQAALESLVNQIQNLDSDSKGYRRLISSLKKKLASKKLAADVRDDLKAFLDDQNPG